MNCLQASVKYESQALAMSINTQCHWYRRKRFAESAIRLLNICEVALVLAVIAWRAPAATAQAYMWLQMNRM